MVGIIITITKIIFQKPPGYETVSATGERRVDGLEQLLGSSVQRLFHSFELKRRWTKNLKQLFQTVLRPSGVAVWGRDYLYTGSGSAPLYTGYKSYWCRSRAMGSITRLTDLRAMGSENQTINLHSLPHRIVFEDPTEGYEECLFLQPQIDPDLK